MHGPLNIKKDMYFIVETHSVPCLLLSNDKLYIHSGGSLEY